MPKTESEWQELSDLLAREIMGLAQVESLHGLGRLWDSENGHEYHVALTPCYGTFYKVWQPHINITQAMLILKTILAKAGKHATAELMIRILPNRCRVTIQNWVATDGTPAGFVRSPYMDNEMQAICLAAKEWCKTYDETR